MPAVRQVVQVVRVLGRVCALNLMAAMLAMVVMASVRAAEPALPARDLLIELREADAAGGGYVISTRSAAAGLPPQSLRLRNGGEARLAYDRSVAFQWVRTAQASGALTGSGARLQQTWLQAGQWLVLRARWRGAQQPVVVEIERASADFQPEPGAALPAQQRSELLTTVQAPLGVWVEVARTGVGPAHGSYRSDAATERSRELQLRVSLP